MKWKTNKTSLWRWALQRGIKYDKNVFVSRPIQKNELYFVLWSSPNGPVQRTSLFFYYSPVQKCICKLQKSFMTNCWLVRSVIPIMNSFGPMENTRKPLSCPSGLTYFFKNWTVNDLFQPLGTPAKERIRWMWVPGMKNKEHSGCVCH